MHDVFSLRKIMLFATYIELIPRYLLMEDGESVKLFPILAFATSRAFEKENSIFLNSSFVTCKNLGNAFTMKGIKRHYIFPTFSDNDHGKDFTQLL